jgi:hypothetical protein
MDFLLLAFFVNAIFKLFTFAFANKKWQKARVVKF